MTTPPPLFARFRYLSVAILLLAALLPAQQVFACDMMGGQAQAACCCHEQMASDECGMGGCEHTGAQAPLGENGCCKVSLSEPAVYTGVQTVNHAIGVNELVEPPRPPFMALSHPVPATNVTVSTALIFAVQHQPAFQQTYLDTRRLRL